MAVMREKGGMNLLLCQRCPTAAQAADIRSCYGYGPVCPALFRDDAERLASAPLALCLLLSMVCLFGGDLLSSDCHHSSLAQKSSL